jgi:FHS family L-fucose permease-like MFS transporter
MNVISTNGEGRQKLVSQGFLFAFILVTSLFFLWGTAHSLLDVLNKHFQVILGITKSKSGWVQAALYGGYFFMGIPAGLIMNRFGYKKGIIFGLLIYACGAFLFMPAAKIQTFEFTLLCLFVIACGLTLLETAANPYSTVLGPKNTSEQRLNLSQSFNGLGWIVGPAIGGLLIFGKGSGAETNKFASMVLPYMIIGTFVLLIAVMFMVTKMPEIHEGEFDDKGDKGKYRDLFKIKHFRASLLAQFLYVAAQTGVNSFFINYVTEVMPQFSNEKASYLLSLGFAFFMVGRFSGSILMSWFKPNQMLMVYAIVNVFAMALVIMGVGWVSLVALYLNYFCMSIMFPTIFALGIKDLGGLTKKGSSLIVMMIVGGAVCPMFMGWIADVSKMSIGFIVPLVCFIVIAWFGYSGYKVKTPSIQNSTI